MFGRDAPAGAHLAAPEPKPPGRLRRLARGRIVGRGGYLSGSIVPVYFLVGALAVTGGARPTAITVVDGVLLAGGAVGVAACARRARTVPVYVATAVAAATQTEVVPMVFGVAGLVAAVSLQTTAVRRSSTRRARSSALAGGLAWAAMVGAPTAGAGPWWPVPLAAFAWLVLSARFNGGEEFQRRWTAIVAGTGLVAVVFALAGVFAVLSASADVERGASRLDDGLAAARSGDVEEAAIQLQRATSALQRANRSLDAVWAKPALLVPGVSQHTRSLTTAVDAAAEVAAVASDTVEEVDLERFGAEAGRIDVEAIAAVEEPLAELVGAMAGARADLAGLDDLWLLPIVRDEISEVQDRLDDASTSAQLALDGVRVVPGLLGADEPRTYLVLFTSPAEARARTGWPGNFAELTFDGGQFDMTRFGRIGELNRAVPDGGVALTGPDDFLDRYAQFQVDRDWRNIVLSPDFPSVADVADQLYAGSGLGDLDGVMSVDPTALAALLAITGPVAIPDGPTLDADNAVQYLVHDQYVEFEDDNPDRVDALEVVAAEVFDRLSTSDLPGPQALGQRFGPAVQSGHLQFFAGGPDEADFLADLGIDGAYPAVDGDFFGFTTTNSSGNKIDVFLERSLDYTATWDPATGALEATAVVTLTNTAPASGLPDVVIGNALGRRPREDPLPTGWHRVYLTLYSPWGATASFLDGEPLALNRKRELDRYAYATFVDIPPGGTRKITVEVTGTLAGGGENGSAYRLDLISQPMVVPDAASVEVSMVNAAVRSVDGPASPASNGDPTIVGTAIDLSRHQTIVAEVSRR